MESKLKLHNTLSRTKEDFVPLVEGRAGMYVCGPTVYGDPHLGHARAAITFDILFRWLTASGYKVRYVRNVTDVGHLENDGDQGEDKLEKRARLEKLEPMEVAHHYTERYHRAMDRLGVLTPSIEPRASGHVIEQIEMTRQILNRGFAYESNGSVYFDVEKYNQAKMGRWYGELSGRVLDELISNTRGTAGQGDKRSPFDFALWKKASPEHIMRWPSPWSDGFPGWHLECSAMSRKYLGERFDIHGGGMDLMFPHHECEIAQTTVACGIDSSARYWVHNNMITINGQKMGKSLGNFITLDELFAGSHPALVQAYSPMTIRFFILQAHYRSTLDFSNEALQAAEKGLDRLFNAIDVIPKIKPSTVSTVDVAALERDFCEAMDDDLNTPIAISVLFEWVKVVNLLNDGQGTITEADRSVLQETFGRLVHDVLGLSGSGESEDKLAIYDTIDKLVAIFQDQRKEAKGRKDWAASDAIRDRLSAAGIQIKDTKEGYEWDMIAKEH